jgi:hypothetical protein
MAGKNYDDLLALAGEQDTVDQSLFVIVDGLKAQVTDILSGVVIPPAVQAKLDAAFDKFTANKEAVAAKVLENTPQATT